MTAANKTARANFARRYQNFDWSTVIFTDEKTFRSSQDGRLSLWRYDRTRYAEEHVVPNRASGRISVNMWGWISSAGVGELAQLPSRANAIDYVEKMDTIMVPTVRCVYPQEEVPNIHFVHDNCPTHKARVTKNWFRQHPDIIEIPWPSKSPDLNPIENIRGIMVQRWENGQERKKQALEEHCHEVWESLRHSDICSRIVESMPARLQAVSESNGARIYILYST